MKNFIKLGTTIQEWKNQGGKMWYKTKSYAEKEIQMFVLYMLENDENVCFSEIVSLIYTLVGMVDFK